MKRKVVNIDDTVPDVDRPTGIDESPATYICSLCGGRAWPVEASALRTKHFAHRRGGVCLSEHIDFNPFSRLWDVRADRAVAARMRIRFRQNWEMHYRRLHGRYGGLVPFLSWREFLHMMTRATDRDVFGLRDIVGDNLPQLLALMIKFPQENAGLRSDGSFFRNHWFRFWWLEPPGGRGDLWIFTQLRNEFVRGSFLLPAAGKNQGPTIS